MLQIIKYLIIKFFFKKIFKNCTFLNVILSLYILWNEYMLLYAL